ncbi:MAG: putative bifunctional diguanylate cyclase/phosphodiesterase [Candidatus Coproplasma sp.]
MMSQLLAFNNPGLRNLPYLSFDICAIVLNTFVLINFTLNKKLNNTQTRLFYTLAISSLLASVFNLVCVMQSVVAINELVLGILNILFVASYNVAGIIFFIYVVNMIYGNISKILWCRIAAVALAAIVTVGLILNILTVCGITDIQKSVYVAMMNGCQLLSTVFAVILVILNRKKLSGTQRINIYLFSAVNAFANVWQIMINYGLFAIQIQLVAFALSVAVLLAYVTLQRPEDEIDQVSGMFNSHTHLYRTNERLRSGKPFMAFVFELSNMAIVNTTFGIKGGNEVIKTMANRIRNVLPKKLLLYRLNGARFAINFNEEAEYKEFEPKFKAVFEEPVEINETKIRIVYTGCLIAMPSVTDKVSDIEEVLKYYRSTSKASDKVMVADKEAVEKSRRRERVEYAIQNALKNGGFEVYYQPIYSVAEKRISSCEALLRLKDADLGFIGPDEFIPIAEETGRIVEIGHFVMEEVCRFIKEENIGQYGIDFIDVNLSVIQCMHPEITEDINSIIAMYDVPRGMVNLEVTETASAKSYALLQSRLKELHRSGFTISLDDFGSGFSSVEYLINFPFDIVKLDKALVWAYMSTEKYEPILKHYMPMLHGLGLKIVAEGVETKEMLEALEELGCDYIQGYYFSRPIPKAKFLEYIKNASKGILTA